MRRALLLLATVACSLSTTGCADTDDGTLTSPGPLADLIAARDRQLGDPLPGLTAAQLAAFNRGKEVFERTFDESTGLGPTFNASSCAECHGEPEEGGVTGASGDEVETHFTRERADGTCNLLINRGGFVRQDSVTPTLFALTGLTREPLPSTEHQRGSRTTVDVFGFGLLDAVPNATLVALSDPNDLDNDGVSGRVHRTAAGDVGKFGRKAQEGSLSLFNAGAFLAEMGVTNRFNTTENTIGGDPLPPGADHTADPELANGDLNDLNAFMRFLAPPPQVPLTPEATVGKVLFHAIGCAGCHVPTLITGDAGADALSFKRVDAFTDLLLHDMGADAADICLDQANRSEFRTEPLMGARFMETFMHDGRALTIRQAIQLHAGEGARARNQFQNLNSIEKAALVAYIKSI